MLPGVALPPVNASELPAPAPDDPALSDPRVIPALYRLSSLATRTEDPAVMQLYTGWVGWAVSTVLVLNAWVTPQSLNEWALLLMVGLAATLGQYLLIVAFSKAPASVVSPFLYTGVAFSTVMGWWLFDHIPDALAFTGMGLVVLCGVVAGRIKGAAKA